MKVFARHIQNPNETDKHNNEHAEHKLEQVENVCEVSKWNNDLIKQKFKNFIEKTSSEDGVEYLNVLSKHKLDSIRAEIISDSEDDSCEFLESPAKVPKSSLEFALAQDKTSESKRQFIDED